jgi:phospholipid/cholesterol/gamma-HCH transport system substrate-binding protein
MTIRKKDKKNLVKVGAFITGLTLVVMIMVVSIGKQNAIFNPKVDLRARVKSASALKEGSYVEFKGIRIGSVTDINIVSEDEVELTLTVLEEEVKWIKQDAKVAISNAGLVGDKFVEIYNGEDKTSATLKPSTDILRSEDSMDFKKIMTKGDSIATIAERIMLKVDTILLNMEDGQKFVETFNNMSNASNDFAEIMADAKRAKLGETIANVNMTMERLSKASGSLERIMARIEKGPGSANSMIYDDSLHEDLKTLLGGAERNKVIKYFIRESIRSSEQKKK